MPEEKEIKKRSRRTRIAIERDVFQAVGSLIEEVGYANVTLTGVAERAKIEPAVFYRRYASLDVLFDKYTQQYDYWLGNLTDSLPENLKEEEIFRLIMSNLIKAFSKSKGMQQLIIWELSDDNPVTRRTAGMRELVNEPVIRMLENTFKDTDLDVNAISAIIISGVYYLILHRKRSRFCDVDFSTKHGKERLEQAVEQLITMLFANLEQTKRNEEIASRLRAEGVSDEIIRKCLQ